MDKKLYIFDMDGTLLDSMPLWHSLDNDYLGSYNITPPADLDQVIAPLTLPECADYFISLGIDKDRDSIVSEIISIISSAYQNSVPLKPGMGQLLEKLCSEENIICLLTTSERTYALPALKRLNIYKYFDAVYTSTELNLDKRTPEIYKTVCRKYNISPANTTVYEDTLFAIRSAKEAGCHVVAVYDNDSSGYWEEIKNTADETLLE